MVLGSSDNESVVDAVMGSWSILVDIVMVNGWVVSFSMMSCSVGISVQVKIVVSVMLIWVRVLMGVVIHWLHLEHKVSS